METLVIALLASFMGTILIAALQGQNRFLQLIGPLCLLFAALSNIIFYRHAYLLMNTTLMPFFCFWSGIFLASRSLRMLKEQYNKAGQSS